MENKILEQNENNTNIAEAATSQANRKVNQLKLIRAIYAEIYDRFGVPYPKRDKSEVKVTAMAQKDKRNDIINQDQERPENKKKGKNNYKQRF
ncbi:hypothetical protein RclHR1_00230003 [Rhizophagus clarus]|uniref:Uncharacterized protein n=1 Tax=Rhizophagus clarus TaxID=94130 RepID=A0A2Z6QX49_9GLOM|nr:hypothetical protein RclHR1_00230003 [Rhizophagus clarus]